MPLLAFLGPLKCVCRVVTAFFMAFLIFPAGAETASPPISGSNGLMGLWGANSSAPQTGSSGKPISGSNEQQGATAPGTPTESSPPSANSQDAELELESTKRATKCRATAHIRFQWADGRVGRKQLATAKRKADQRFQRPTGHHCSWDSHRVRAQARMHRMQSSSRVHRMQGSSRSPPSAPRNVAPLPSAQSGSNGLIEWSANTSELQTGSSGKPISGSNEQQDATAPGILTEPSPPSATQDAELESSPQDAELKSSPPDAELEVEVHQARHEMSRLCPVLNPVPMD